MENENLFLQTLKYMTFFRQFLFELVTFTITSFPEEFNTSIEQILRGLTDMRDEELETLKTMRDLRRTKTMKYMAKFMHNLNPVSQLLIDKDENAILTGPHKLLFAIAIDYKALWEHPDMLPEVKKKIMAYLVVLYKYSDLGSRNFVLTEKMHQKAIVRKQTRVYKRNEIKKCIMKMLGPEGYNETIEIMVNDILDEFEKNHQRLINGTMDQDEMADIVKDLYEKLIQKYRDGHLKSEELVASSRQLFKMFSDNTNKDFDITKVFGELSSIINIDELNECQLMEMMRNGELNEKLKEAGFSQETIVNRLEEYVTKYREENDGSDNEPESSA